MQPHNKAAAKDESAWKKSDQTQQHVISLIEENAGKGVFPKMSRKAYFIQDEAIENCSVEVELETNQN